MNGRKWYAIAGYLHALLIALAALSLSPARAAEITASTGVGVSVAGNTGTVSPLSELLERPVARSPLSDLLNRPAKFDTWNNTAGAWPEGEAKTKLPIPGTSRTAAGQVRVPVSRPSVGGALARFARKQVPGLANAIALAELIQELGLILEPDGEGGGKVSSEEAGGDCNYSAGGSLYANPQAFCAGNSRTFVEFIFYSYNGNYCNVSIKCSGGLVTSPGLVPRTGTGVPKRELTEQELADLIASKSGWPSGSKIGPAIAEALRAGEKIETEPGSKPKVTGEPEVTGQPKVTEKTNPDGSKEVKTETTKHQITYNNNEYKVTNITTTVINTYNPDGSPKDTTTEEKTEEPDKEPERPDECDEHPDRIGCSEYGDPEDQELPTKEVTVTFTPVPFQTVATCPAPITFTLENLGPASKGYEFSVQPVCDAASTYARPVVLVIAAALAAFVFIGGLKT